MSLSRAIRKTVGRLLIGALLFAQLAIASHACPGLSVGALAMAPAAPWALAQQATAPSSSLASWEQSDASADNLCAGHCQQGQQSADAAPAPAVYAAIPTLLYSLPKSEPLLAFGRSSAASKVSLAAAPAPPHAILHCVLRT